MNAAAKAGDLKPRNDMILVTPDDAKSEIYLPPENKAHGVVKGVVIGVGPYVNVPENAPGNPFITDDDQSFKPDSKLDLEVRQRHKRNEVHIGDLIYFPAEAAFILESRPNKIYAISAEHVVAVVPFL